MKKKIKENVYPVGLVMTKELFDRVDSTSKKMGISKSGYIRYVLINELEKNDKFSQLDVGESG